jgi:hypothetical protein
VPRWLIVAGMGVAAAVIAAFTLLGNQAIDPIAQAATTSAGAPGYRMNMTLNITSPQLPAPISATGSAVVDVPDKAVSMSLDMDLSQLPGTTQVLGSSTMRLGAILDGGVIYVQFPQSIVARLPTLAGKSWLKVNIAKAAGLPGFSSLGADPTASDPSQALQELKAGADSVTNEGQQWVDGVRTTHYRAQLNLDRMLPHVPPAQRALLQRLVQGEIPIDVWVDAHHLVRRIDMFLALSLGTGPSLQETMTADFTDYGPQPRPTPPPADQVTDASGIAGVSG